MRGTVGTHLCLLYIFLTLTLTSADLSHSDIVARIRPTLSPQVQQMVDWVEADPALLDFTEISDTQRLERFMARLLDNKTYEHMLISDMNRRINSEKIEDYEFPCKSFKPGKAAQTIHELTPYDIKVVGAMGDSLTAGNGIDAKNIIGVLRQFRYKSFSIGGDENFEVAPTLPNILRKYRPDVIGASTGICRAGRPCSNFNMAVPAKTSRDMAAQARELVQAIKQHPGIDFNNDWKVVTVFIGQNDICSSSCKFPNEFTVDMYRRRLQDGLDILHNELPRTFVNLVTLLDAYLCKQLNIGSVCTAIHLYECPCGAFWPFYSTTKRLNEAFQQETENIVNSGRYDDKDDFAVVLQPFFQKTNLPLTDKGAVDTSYFAPDCFHFSAKAQAEAAKSLWNSMIEPVGSKKTNWHIGEPYECPSADKPYFFTKNNSKKLV